MYGLFAAGHSDHLGAFVVQGGPFTVGVQVDPRGAHVHLFGLSGWLQQEEETVSDRFGRPIPRPRVRRLRLEPVLETDAEDPQIDVVRAAVDVVLTDRVAVDGVADGDPRVRRRDLHVALEGVR